MPRVEVDLYDENKVRGIAHIGRRDMDISWPRLLHAAVTTGRRNWRDVLVFGSRSVLDVAGRISFIQAALRSYSVLDQEQRFVKTARFRRYDSSERQAVTFWIGLAFAGAVSHRLYDTRWLMHFDTYRDDFDARLFLGRMRPDLFGLDKSGMWVVLEAKGRSGSLNDVVRKKAKDQSKRVSTIGGVVPGRRAAILSWFEKDVLRADAVDPPEAGEMSVPIGIDKDKFVSDYYRRLLVLIGSAAPISYQGRTVFVTSLGDARVEVGLVAEVHALLQERYSSILLDTARPTDIRGIHDEVVRVLPEFDFEGSEGGSEFVGTMECLSALIRQ